MRETATTIAGTDMSTSTEVAETVAIPRQATERDPLRVETDPPANADADSTGSDLPVVSCARVPITACTLTEAAREMVRLATSDLTSGVGVHLCNAYTLALADKDPAYLEMLQQASLNFPDGKPVAWANRLFHHDSVSPGSRVRGPDLFLKTFELGQEVGLRHYLLGSTPDVLETLQVNLLLRFPRARIVGTESPPFRELSAEESRAQVRRIRESGAQIVWVGLGTPKQDWQVARLRDKLPLVFAAVGAAFDFAAGTKKQAPLWMQQTGLEWTHRLATEPGRLWKRYLFGNARFVYAACLHKD